jgi:predicted small lipoprotein YifL
MSFIVSESRWSLILLVLMSLVGCTAPTYLTVPPADVADQQYRGLSPIMPTQPIVRDQHLGQLQAEMRYQEELLSRAEENRLQACRTPEATQVDLVAYQRCQLKDQMYEQLKAAAAMARDRYLRAVSGRGGGSI